MTRKAKPPIALYSALADTTRCRIIEILADGPIPVHRLADGFSISRPAISRHLRVLKQAGLVAEVKKGRENLYAFRPQKLGKAVGWIETLNTADATPEPSVEVPEAKVIAEPVAEPIVIAVKSPEIIKPEKPKVFAVKKPAADAAEPKPASISQMGFDF